MSPPKREAARLERTTRDSSPERNGQGIREAEGKKVGLGGGPQYAERQHNQARCVPRASNLLSVRSTSPPRASAGTRSITKIGAEAEVDVILAGTLDMPLTACRSLQLTDASTGTLLSSARDVAGLQGPGAELIHRIIDSLSLPLAARRTSDDIRK